MTDNEFLHAFETLTFPPAKFHHEDHVRLAWIYLRESSLLEALDRFTTSLQRFADAIGKSALYHATITWAYMLLIHERMARGDADTFDDFRRANPDLFAWKPSVLSRYYKPSTLDSPLARTTFVLPDLAIQ